MSISKFLQPYLASYNLEKLDVKDDKEIIITEILNKGDDKALLWLSKNYSRDEVERVVSIPTRGLWMKSVLKYWLYIFGINLPQKDFKRALLDLNI